MLTRTRDLWTNSKDCDWRLSILSLIVSFDITLTMTKSMDMTV